MYNLIYPRLNRFETNVDAIKNSIMKKGSERIGNGFMQIGSYYIDLR